MDTKLLLQEIADFLAAKQGISKRKADAFCKIFFEVIEEGLLTDKYVKVKGLGSFKIVPVKERESVNVNTGERIQISGHSKVSFNPDAWISDLVNKPFSQFKTEILNDEISLEELESVQPLPSADTGDAATEASAEETPDFIITTAESSGEEAADDSENEPAAPAVAAALAASAAAAAVPETAAATPLLDVADVPAENTEEPLDDGEFHEEDYAGYIYDVEGNFVYSDHPFTEGDGNVYDEQGNVVYFVDEDGLIQFADGAYYDDEPAAGEESGDSINIEAPLPESAAIATAAPADISESEATSGETGETSTTSEPTEDEAAETPAKPESEPTESPTSTQEDTAEAEAEMSEASAEKKPEQDEEVAPTTPEPESEGKDATADDGEAIGDDSAPKQPNEAAAEAQETATETSEAASEANETEGEAAQEAPEAKGDEEASPENASQTSEGADKAADAEVENPEATAVESFASEAVIAESAAHDTDAEAETSDVDATDAEAETSDSQILTSSTETEMSVTPPPATPETTPSRRAWWKTLLWALFVLILMILSYIAGSYRLFTPPFDTLKSVFASDSTAAASNQPAAADKDTLSYDGMGVVEDEFNGNATTSPDTLLDEAQAAKIYEEETAKRVEAQKAEAAKKAEDAKKAGEAKKAEPAKTSTAQQPKQAAATAKTAESTPSAKAATHTIKRGESLERIALHYYGNKKYAKNIQQHNGIKNADLIEEGMQLKLPSIEGVGPR